MSNEQRAHDLAICMLSRTDIIYDDMDNVPFDFYKKYQEYIRLLYNLLIVITQMDYNFGIDG